MGKCDNVYKEYMVFRLIICSLFIYPHVRHYLHNFALRPSCGNNMAWILYLVGLLHCPVYSERWHQSPGRCAVLRELHTHRGLTWEEKTAMKGGDPTSSCLATESTQQALHWAHIFTVIPAFSPDLPNAKPVLYRFGHRARCRKWTLITSLINNVNSRCGFNCRL